MSCMMLNEQPISNLAYFLNSLKNVNKSLHLVNDDFFSKIANEYMTINNLDFKVYVSEKHMFEVLVHLNEKAYNSRYEGTHQEYLKDMYEMKTATIKCEYPEYNNYWHYDKKSYIAMYKTLQCYNYQLAEYETSKHPIYLALRELENKLAHWLVCNTEEYNNTRWGV